MPTDGEPSRRVTVVCPGCGGDWELMTPEPSELTVEYCECGALLELDEHGVLRAVRVRRLPAPLDVDSRLPRSLRELLR